MGEQPHRIIIRIRDLRRERSLTQEALAEALGLSRQSVNALETGRWLPSLPVAMQIASYFSVPLQVLFQLPHEVLTEKESPKLPRLLPDSAPTNATLKQTPMNHLVPLSPLREMREMLDELMDEGAWPSPVPAIVAPAVNVMQSEHDVQVEMRLPGFTKTDLSIELGDGFITIAGQKKEEATMDGKHYFRREFATQSFSRTVSLPAPVQAEKAEAKMEHGILHVVLPKQVEEKPKTHKLEISAD